MKNTCLSFLIGLFFFSAISCEAQDGKGKELYMENCAQCHGAGLKGGNAQSLIDGYWQYGDEDHYIHRNIKFGIPHVGMPAYDESLSDDEISMVVDFILNFEKEQVKDMPEVPADLLTLDYQMEMEVVADNLEIPWAIDFISKDHILVTERPGRLRVIKDGKMLDEPVQGTPKVLHAGAR